MKELSHRIMEYSRLGLTVLVLGVLVSAVGGSVERVAADLEAATVQWVSSAGGESMRAVVVDTPDDTEPPGGNMNRTGHSRNPISSPHLTPVILPAPDKTENRVRKALVQPAIEAPQPVISMRQDRAQTTPSLVDSQLGRQFTLVGARPSGTS